MRKLHHLGHMIKGTNQYELSQNTKISVTIDEIDELLGVSAVGVLRIQKYSPIYSLDFNTSANIFEYNIDINHRHIPTYCFSMSASLLA